MAKTNTNCTDEALQWLRCMLNNEPEKPAVTDWNALLDFADKQKIIGVCLPEESPDNIEKLLLLQWIGMAQQIEGQNRLVNKRVEELCCKLEEAGLHCCLLKGQGNAEMYPNPARRCSGDIDVWINADEEKVSEYVKQLYPDAVESFKHIHFPIFEDVPVDVHVTPLKFYNSSYQKRLQRWIESCKREQFDHKTTLTGINRMVNTPTDQFNVVYQLGHMMIHLFDEGVGLRHVVDYYYLLKRIVLTEYQRKEIVSILRDLGMINFAGAMMWVESNVLGLPLELCIVEPDEEKGRRLLDDILEGGNFGHYNAIYEGKTGYYTKGVAETRRVVSLFTISPRECIARIGSKIRGAFLHTIGIR